MNESILSGRLAWLGEALASQRNNITHLLCRLKGIAQTGAISLPHKVMRLLDQIAGDQEKERDLIHEIECVEKKHDELRRRKMLRQADASLAEDAPEKTDAAILLPPEPEPERASLLTLFGLLYLFSSKPIKHKNQDVTVR